ncbi:hypothetical protein F2Q68_00017477 [Brassica cretica]|uniref:Protein kinase domain-containing protein n=1 Tax=Brassica cretica TaxID=69181 RepID=A0A8S9HVC9_BRACR|nr:hypothetical protein F2Q68_00017477 [Brassica cretica]
MVREQAEEKEVRKGMRLGKYELGRTLGEGNFGKVKFAKDTVSGQPFAVKIIDKSRIADLNFSLQVFEIKPSLNVVELRKSYGDSSLYRQLYERLLKEVGTSSPEQELVT